MLDGFSQLRPTKKTYKEKTWKILNYLHSLLKYSQARNLKDKHFKWSFPKIVWLEVIRFSISKEKLIEKTHDGFPLGRLVHMQ